MARACGAAGPAPDVPARRYRALQVSCSVSWSIYLVLTSHITKECTLVAQWYNPVIGLHEILGSGPHIMRLFFVVFSCMYKDIPSTVQVGLGIGMLSNAVFLSAKSGSVSYYMTS